MTEESFFTFSGFTRNTNNFLTPSEEDYIEMIYRIYLETNLPIKVNDLANKLNVKPPSVTKMIKKLSLKNIVHFEKYKQIFLKDKGIEIGKFLINRHNTIEKFLRIINSNINITYETEKIEHTLSKETLNQLNILVNFFESNEKILKYFHEFSRNY